MRKLLVITAIAAALVLLPQVTQAQFKTGDLTLAISGQGVHGPDMDGTTIGMTGELGYFVTQNLELSLRQTLAYSDQVAGADWSGATSIAADWHFDMGKWQPYVGASIGFIYGNDDSWIAGPEVGVKYFVKPDVYLQLNVQYQFFLQETVSDGQFVYGLSVGFKLN